jgi:hypothetical protein
LFFGLMFFVSTFFAYKELKYWLRGRTMEAREAVAEKHRAQPLRRR